MASSALCLKFFSSCTPITSSLNPTTKKHGNTTLNNAQITTPSFMFANNNNKELAVLTNPISQSNATTNVKVPTPPWIKGPLVLQPHELLNLTNPKNKKPIKNDKIEKDDKALTAKESGVRGNKAMIQIVKSVERLQRDENLKDTQEISESGESLKQLGKERILNVFGDKRIVRSTEKLQKDQNLKETPVNSGGFEIGEGLKQLNGDGVLGFRGKKLPWVREERVGNWRMKKEKLVSKAELSLDKELLERLRGEAAKMRTWVKVKKAGVTQSVVNEIRLTWRTSELAMMKFYMPLCRNMNRARDIVEMKTGGLVVWTRKDIHVVYRGCNYQGKKNFNTATIEESFPRNGVEEESISAGILMEADLNTQPINGSLFERETDRLLDGLGPCFVDWWMRKPLPVDADLLPEVVKGFRPPSRICPPRMRSKLKDDELTYLRKLAQSLPTHFVLGRNRRLQGLAAAILKLWEKTIIAKIAVKWGVPNTNNEQMADELKSLTGGVLLLRNKFFIILYRGKDFLPGQVATVIVDREIALRKCQTNEERARMKAIETSYMPGGPTNTSRSGTLHEFQEFQIKFQKTAKGDSEIQLEAYKEKLERELRNQEYRLCILKSKIEKPARDLSKLNSAWVPSPRDADQGIMTEEERECFRKIGLKLRGSLVLGRRGVFEGVMEGLHQHWKHREVVKVITMQRVFSQVIHTATLLEAESDGILVSVDKLKEGHAIIIYRGKNYKRPLRLLKKNLLTKREALKRSLLIQRVGSLKFFANQRERVISDLKLKLAELHRSKEKHLKSDIL
ncbi:PREDICTED: chloroplastic group IIA intron splicing facilitator CRS1, chloroplastic [Populus euphratica]|uniref:Chloroplastic group IIA intron splicing facilitator CRS1, chloroplastic n=1 Tax=Populus euphratica TaxID=75702 RepID=A0AAJ6U1V8_POPEU|nr:PREDICTED: chloroplastic group IIA intron splicing facilitator CRS1, chloroplastic [Populus euphratica]XP_011021271.1 PREDICTED: chloroplastic group IIA intron splicing facilitator CRS1, chloroplastic [Populus euphratica]XP_011021272.1 PREDICTED: chloroplastic group IIA intron splicing facilitator CRS1, chloroplastic [Populus euphratica]XP_011021273.1 PREDICTED: chloroplastic group IIA intron splicing facilitator CRS1, chloroplastic [Populus euphratica]XP_011021274.1 PREDICTED: chloroplastic